MHRTRSPSRGPRPRASSGPPRSTSGRVASGRSRAARGSRLTTDLAAAYGIGAYLRQLVRWTRGAAHLTLMRGWLDELEDALGEPALQTPQPTDLEPDADGFGVTNATRGTLMYWVTLRAGRIRTYQVITPTTWNASPRGSHAEPGHFEQSLVGLPANEPGRGLRALVLPAFRS